MEYPLGSWMHWGVDHPRLEARGRPFQRSPRSRSPVNLRVLRSLTWGPQGQPSPPRTPQGRPGVQGIFPTARCQAPHGWPMVHHSMATGIPVSRGFCFALLVSHPIPCSPLPHPITSPIPASHGFSISQGWCAAPFHPSSRVCTPPGRQQPCGAGPLNRHPSGDHFVRLALVAPIPYPPHSPVPRPVTHLTLFLVSCGFQVSWGRRVALARCPFLSRPLFPASRVFTPPGRQQPFGAGPLDPHPYPSWDRFVCLALFAPFPPPSAWGVCFLQDLSWFLLPGPRAFFFFARHPRSLVCPFTASGSPAARSFCASRPSVSLRGFVLVVVLVLVFFVCPPLPHGASCLVVPSSLHARTSTWHRPSVTALPGALPLPHRPPGAWRLAVPGHAIRAPLPRVSLTSLLSTLPSLPSPVRPITVVLLLRVLSPLVVPAPWLSLREQAVFLELACLIVQFWNSVSFSSRRRI